MRYYLYIIFVIIFTSGYAQDISLEKIDEMEYQELYALYLNEKDAIKIKIIARAYINKAQKEKDSINIATGYVFLAIHSRVEKKIIYADSVIHFSKKLKNKVYPAIGYLHKAYGHHEKGELLLSSENFLKAYKLAIINNHIEQQIYVSQFLIHSKIIWGNKKEALALQKKRHQLIKSKNYYKNIKEYTEIENDSILNIIHAENDLSSISTFAFCYLALKQLDSAKNYIQEGFEKLKYFNGNNKSYYTNYLKEIYVEINFHSKKYAATIDSVNNFIPLLDVNKNNSQLLSNLFFIKGLSYIKLKKHHKGIVYLKKSDSIFEEKNIYVQPEQRVLYEELLDYYDSKNNLNKKIEYLDKLIFTDRIFKRNFQFFEPNYINNYKTPQLLEEKEMIINNLKQKNKNTNWWFITFLLLSLFVIGSYFKQQQLYKKRFEKLISHQDSVRLKNTNSDLYKNDIPLDIVENILKNLNYFESKKKYLSPEVSLNEVAKSFETNSTYLSKVINLKIGKSFPEYISDLRINYIIQELSINSKLRKYTIEAIAQDIGFKSGASFSKSFYKKHKIYPSHFIKQLKKNNLYSSNL